MYAFVFAPGNTWHWGLDSWLVDYTYTYLSMLDRPMRETMESTMYRGKLYDVANPDRRRNFAILMLESSLILFGNKNKEKENITYIKVQAQR